MWTIFTNKQDKMTNICEVANKSLNLQINDLNVEINLQSDRIGTCPLIIEKHNNLNDHSKKNSRNIPRIKLLHNIGQNSFVIFL